MIVDTHTHLYLPEFNHDREAAVRRALESGVGKMILPNVDESTVASMKELHDSFPECMYMAMGLHPTEVGESYKSDMAFVESEFANRSENYVAVGEIGIDLYWDKTYLNEQIEVFSKQIDIAINHSLPVIIHCREGLKEVLRVLVGKKKVPQGVFHSFGGTVEDVKAIRSVGDFYFGINGIVTFKNSQLGNVLPEIGIERLLIETDSPYLSPVPYRGKRNESSYIVHTAQKIANVLNVPFEEVAKATSENAFRLFAIS